MSFGSDWPVTSQIPMEGIGVAVTRQTDDGEPSEGWVPAERITLDEALGAYTHGTAVQAGEAHLWGSLQVGHRADVVAFRDNLHGLEPLELRNARVAATWFGGTKVYG